MALWSRFKRVVRSFFGWFVELGEDPELILKQNIRDLEDQIPALNEQLATIKATETLQRKEVEKLERQEQDLSNKIRAALKTNRELALNFATTLDQVRQSKQDAQQQLALATQAYEKALKIKKAFLAEKEKKVAAARNALNAKKKAEWQSKVAEAMHKFSPTGVDATHDEMIRKIEENAAHSEAKLEIALESANLENGGIDLDAEAKKIQANSTLAEFERELGLVENVPADIKEGESTQQKTIGPRERELA